MKRKHAKERLLESGTGKRQQITFSPAVLSLSNANLLSFFLYLSLLPLPPSHLLLCSHSKSFNGSACCIVLIYMTYTMLPLRLRESLIGGMLLSGTHLYSCLTHTTTQYTRQLDTQLAMETQTELQAALPWQEVSKGESAALQLFVAATNQVGGGVAGSSINRFCS